MHEKKKTCRIKYKSLVVRWLDPLILITVSCRSTRSSIKIEWGRVLKPLNHVDNQSSYMDGSAREPNWRNLEPYSGADPSTTRTISRIIIN